MAEPRFFVSGITGYTVSAARQAQARALCDQLNAEHPAGDDS